MASSEQPPAAVTSVPKVNRSDRRVFGPPPPQFSVLKLENRAFGPHRSLLRTSGRDSGGSQNTAINYRAAAAAAGAQVGRRRMKGVARVSAPSWFASQSRQNHQAGLGLAGVCRRSICSRCPSEDRSTWAMRGPRGAGPRCRQGGNLRSKQRGRGVRRSCSAEANNAVPFTGGRLGPQTSSSGRAHAASPS